MSRLERSSKKVALILVNMVLKDLEKNMMKVLVVV